MSSSGSVGATTGGGEGRARSWAGVFAGGTSSFGGVGVSLLEGEAGIETAGGGTGVTVLVG